MNYWRKNSITGYFDTYMYLNSKSTLYKVNKTEIFVFYIKLLVIAYYPYDPGLFHWHWCNGISVNALYAPFALTHHIVHYYSTPDTL